MTQQLLHPNVLGNRQTTKFEKQLNLAAPKESNKGVGTKKIIAEDKKQFFAKAKKKPKKNYGIVQFC